MPTLPSYTTAGHTITFAYEQPLQISILTPAIVRVFSDHGERVRPTPLPVIKLKLLNLPC
jgi:hypothetical protein